MKKFKANGKEGVNLLCGLKDGSPFRVYRVLRKIKDAFVDDLHFHPKGYEYYYVIKGRIVINLSDKDITVNTNELLCVEPKEKHKVVSVKKDCGVIIIRNEFSINDKISVDNTRWDLNND